MPLDNTNKSITAFKNLLGKSQTDSGKELGNEAEGIFLNIPSGSIFAQEIPDNDPTTAVEDGLAVFVTADMILDGTSNGHALFAQWPTVPPTGTDPKTSAAYAYGAGTLEGIAAGDRVRNIISSSFGTAFEAKPFAGANAISGGDQRDWFFQYNSGIFFQESGVLESFGGSAFGNPTTIKIYAYTGLTGADVTVGDVPFRGGNISVSAILNSPSPTGSPLADEYTGTAGSPGIFLYDTTVIYLTTFNADNTGPVRINIDAVGLVEIRKGTEEGLVSLEAGDIVASIIYYLAWDGIGFQLFELAPEQLPLTYTNLNPSTVAVGGITAGTTFNNISYTQLFNTMFYPALVSSFTSFGISGQATILEVGNSIAAGSKTFVWNTSNPTFVKPNTIRIKDTTANVWKTALMANDSSEVVSFASPITRTSAGSRTWTIYGQRTNNASFNRAYSVAWRWRTFYGTSASTSLNEAGIEALSNQGLNTIGTGQFNFAAGNYKYFAFPTTFTAAIFFRDKATNLAVAMAAVAEGYTSTTGNGYFFQIVSVTNAYGVTQNYRVYRTRNVLGGSIEIIVT